MVLKEDISSTSYHPKCDLSAMFSWFHLFLLYQQLFPFLCCGVNVHDVIESSQLWFGLKFVHKTTGLSAVLAD
jgi:hypothetical protein